MSSEVVLKLKVIFLLVSIFINKHSFEVVCKKVCVCGQVELEISEGRKNNKNAIFILTHIKYDISSEVILDTFISLKYIFTT